MAKIKKIILFFRTILNNYANSSPSQKGQKCELRVRQRSAFLVKKGQLCPNCVQIWPLPHFCHKSANPTPCFANPFYANAKAPEGRVRGVLVICTNTNRSILKFCELSNNYFTQRLFIFKLCYRVRRCKKKTCLKEKTNHDKLILMQNLNL
mgnify:CR=1 FL=1